ncbi:primosomal protein DnaI [Tetragenococcus koreensis]|uniref:Primosomal protein DnaI n=1 Tax=Tetragenococcus koreensis TaxID=290335 RepID=A0AAN4UBR4_9ENTE|nr:primosomal protein DnaI [Tetragenococcus koreensis]AYW45126.1 primosomal protein DnaI [Tetragenococcus koreensis]MCF1584463.1 primosomal protein DnaI [Tetragenococcus koreensis]MCF1614012.1 primosomal protein DnaI [Tetragenococcus koreensis]MCF1616522.1 primosomal protein DnaI [Tetragenococcus koreensis]MCF1618607.1 primosomal protein DnaI [Tetragenococcus koreensis]
MEDIGKNLNKLMNQKNYRTRFSEMMAEVLKDQDVQNFLNEHKNELSEDDIERSYAKLYEFVQEKRKFELNDPTMIAPGYEPQLMLNFHSVDVTYIPTEELVAKQEQDEIRNRIQALNMPKDIQEARMSNYEGTTGRGKAFMGAIDFINAYKDAPKTFHKGLYLVGSFGVGKTYLLGAIARDLAEAGYTSTLLHFPSFAVDMKQSIKKDEVGEKLDAVKSASILMLDDIGADAMSSWIRDDIFGVILQYRMQEQLPTFFSSNFTMSELEQHLSVTQRGEEEPLKAKRLLERIRYLTQEIEMTGRNRRNS